MSNMPSIIEIGHLYLIIIYLMVRLSTRIYQVPSSYGMSKVNIARGAMLSLIFSKSPRLSNSILHAPIDSLDSELFLVRYTAPCIPYFYLNIRIGQSKKITTLLFWRFRSSFLLGKRTISNFLVLKVYVFLWPSWT